MSQIRRDIKATGPRCLQRGLDGCPCLSFHRCGQTDQGGWLAEQCQSAAAPRLRAAKGPTEEALSAPREVPPWGFTGPKRDSSGPAEIAAGVGGGREQ